MGAVGVIAATIIHPCRTENGRGHPDPFRVMAVIPRGIVHHRDAPQGRTRGEQSLGRVRVIPAHIDNRRERCADETVGGPRFVAIPIVAAGIEDQQGGAFVPVVAGRTDDQFAPRRGAALHLGRPVCPRRRPIRQPVDGGLKQRGSGQQMRVIDAADFRQPRTRRLGHVEQTALRLHVGQRLFGEPRAPKRLAPFRFVFEIEHRRKDRRGHGDARGGRDRCVCRREQAIGLGHAVGEKRQGLLDTGRVGERFGLVRRRGREFHVFGHQGPPGRRLVALGGGGDTIPHRWQQPRIVQYIGHPAQRPQWFTVILRETGIVRRHAPRRKGRLRMGADRVGQQRGKGGSFGPHRAGGEADQQQADRPGFHSVHTAYHK